MEPEASMAKLVMVVVYFLNFFKDTRRLLKTDLATIPFTSELHDGESDQINGANL